jgi:uncharacterized membrane protein
MKPLIVLLVTFIIAGFIIKFNHIPGSFDLAARIAMGVMLLFTALGHFMYTKGMVMMIPEFMPFKKALVYLTGLFEVAAAIGFVIPASAYITGCILILFFVLMLPANINAAMHRVDYQKGTYSGDGMGYLWFRVPLQIFFILWVYICMG